MKKTWEIDEPSTQAAPLKPVSAHPTGTCEGCLALTGSFHCDLGVKTEPILVNEIKIGSRSMKACTRLEIEEDYLVEHLKKM